MRKNQKLINNPVYFGLSMLDLSKTITYEFWYDFCKTKIRGKCKTLLYGYRQLHCLCKDR